MAHRRRRSLGVLFALLATSFVALAVWAGLAKQWVILAAAIAIGIWFSELAYKTLG